jgi:DNA primase
MKPGRIGLYYCQACHAAGNLAIFLRKMHVDQRIAEQITQSLAGAKMGYKQTNTSERSFLPETILGAFFKCPTALVEAGFSMSTLRDYDIGYDEKRERITFPLRDVQGRLIGISGRAMGNSDGPRYLIYTRREFPDFPEYEQPHKDFIWNLHRLYAQHLQGEIDTLFIVEGFKVCLWLIQNGYHSTVAVVGSRLTQAQLKLLASLQGKFVLALDNDSAGLRGMYDLGKRLAPFGQVTTVDPGVLDLKDTQQLDELDADSLNYVLERTIPFVKFAQKMQRRGINEPS